jgi:hypothetical protein
MLTFRIPTRADACKLKEGEVMVLDTLWSAIEGVN